jgi:omega-amidase
MIYRHRGADIIMYPGAFNMTTGPLHWRLLQQGRAVDNQIFVCSCSPARDPDFSYVAWGHSMVVGPFGEVLSELEHEEGILLQEIDFAQLKERRENMPLESQRRPDLYGVVDEKKPG